MAFAHGVEPRCPFLSPAVVEHAATLPPDFHLAADGMEKRLLKQAFGSFVPPAIIARPKQPYRAPGSTCFVKHAGRFVDWVEDRLARRVLETIEPLDVDRVERFIDKMRHTPSERISAREEQAFLLLVSLLELDRQFVQGAGREFVGPPPPLRRAVICTHDDDPGVDTIPPSTSPGTAREWP